jgi:hypothetical protein
MESKLIEIGDKFKNNRGDIFTVTKVSNTGLFVTAKDNTGESFRFKYYEQKNNLQPYLVINV